MNNQICPYTCGPVADIESNREHIVPDALGGANVFALRALAEKNGDYAESIDTPLIHLPLVAMAATRAGVVSRSGPVSWSSVGELSDGSQINVEITREQADFRFRVPVVSNTQSGQVAGVRGFGDRAQAELERVTRDLARKGKQVVAGQPMLLDSTVKVRVHHNHMIMMRGLGKIAYLASTWVLGDSFVSTQAGAKYRKWLDSEATREALASTGILALQNEIEFLPITHKEHAIVCLLVNGVLVTTVRLFGDHTLMSAAFVVEVPELLSSRAGVRQIIIDAATKEMSDTHQEIF